MWSSLRRSSISPDLICCTCTLNGVRGTPRLDPTASWLVFVPHFLRYLHAASVRLARNPSRMEFRDTTCGMGFNLVDHGPGRMTRTLAIEVPPGQGWVFGIFVSVHKSENTHELIPNHRFRAQLQGNTELVKLSSAIEVYIISNADRADPDLFSFFRSRTSRWRTGLIRI